MTASTQHADQRRKHRVTIPEHPQVVDAHSGTVLGQLVNLSSDGLMIAGNNCIQCHTVRQMRIPLVIGGNEQVITVGAESLWCEDANGSGMHWTGFHIIDISPEHQRLLDAIVEG
jgi:hypothetical protein